MANEDREHRERERETEGERVCVGRQGNRFLVAVNSCGGWLKDKDIVKEGAVGDGFGRTAVS